MTCVSFICMYELRCTHIGTHFFCRQTAAVSFLWRISAHVNMAFFVHSCPLLNSIIYSRAGLEPRMRIKMPDNRCMTMLIYVVRMLCLCCHTICKLLWSCLITRSSTHVVVKCFLLWSFKPISDSNFAVNWQKTIQVFFQKTFIRRK